MLNKCNQTHIPGLLVVFGHLHIFTGTHYHHHISMPYVNQGRDKILEHAVASRSELCVQGHADVISWLRTGLSSRSSQPVATLGITVSL